MIRMFLGLPDPDLSLFGKDPDLDQEPSSTSKKVGFLLLVLGGFLLTFYP